MELIGTVVATPAVARVKNGTGYALMLQVQFSDARDVRTAQFMPQTGEDTVPIKGSKVAVFDIGGILLAVSSQDPVSSARSAFASTRAPGEKEFYSSDGTQKLFRLALKANGKLYAGNGLTGTNLRGVLQELAEGILAATYISSSGTATPIADTSGKIAKALNDIIIILDASA